MNSSAGQPLMPLVRRLRSVACHVLEAESENAMLFFLIGGGRRKGSKFLRVAEPVAANVNIASFVCGPPEPWCKRLLQYRCRQCAGLWCALKERDAGATLPPWNFSSAPHLATR